MSCDLCAGDRNPYSPACLTCGGRYLRAIQRHPKRSREWLAKALADWMAHGHDESQLRELSKRKPQGGRADG